MDRKELAIAGIVVVIAVIVAGIIFAPSPDVAKNTSLDILNKGDFGANSTVYIKLTDDAKNALSDKEVHVKLTDKKGNVVYDKTVKTHATGVGLAKLGNVPAGEYDLNVTFDGDGNYTGCSISKKITVKGEVVEDIVDNSTLIQDTLNDADSDDDNTQDSSSYSRQQTSYTPSSSSSSRSSSSSSSSSSEYTNYDVDGNPSLPEYDEDGNEV